MSEQTYHGPKKGRGRPRIYSDSERSERQRASSKRTKEKYNPKYITIRAGAHEEFLSVKNAESTRLGFPLQNAQFFLLLLKNWKETHKK
jgi:hypothetical protein